MRCGSCGEQWDLDSIHDEITALNYDEIQEWKKNFPGFTGDPGRKRQAYYEEHFWNPALKEFRKLGCKYFGTSHNEYVDKDAAAVSNILTEFLGDDVDGIENMLEDIGF